MNPTLPQLVRREAGLVIFYPPASTLSITGLAQTQTDPSTVLSFSRLVVLRSVAASRLRIVAVILRAAQSPLVVARLGLLDKVLSTFPQWHEVRGEIPDAGTVV